MSIIICIENGSYIKDKFDDFILLIQTIVSDEGIDLYKIEQKLIDLQSNIFNSFLDDKILNYGKKYIFECIKFTLTHNLTNSLLEDNNTLLFDGFNMLIKKILSLSNEITEGPQMIEDLIVILVILSLYLYEPKGGELANWLFNWWSSNHNSDAFFIVLEMTLSQVYSNELDISCKLSNQQIAIIFKSIFKWLIKSVSMFAIVGVKITIIENLCNSLSVWI